MKEGIVKENKIGSGHSLFFGKGYVIASAVIAVLLAIAFEYFIQYRVGYSGLLVANRPLFFFSATVLLCIIVFCSAVVGNVFLGGSIFLGLLMIITYANRAKFAARGENLYPSDIVTGAGNFNEVQSMADPHEVAKQWIIIGVILAVGALMTFLIVRARHKAGRYSQENKKVIRIMRTAGVRIVIAVCAVIAFMALSNVFVQPDSAAAKKIGFDFIAWNQNQNYGLNGFVAGFLSNMTNGNLAEPEGYSEKAVADIVARYKAQAAAGNKGRTDLKSLDTDIVFILNESFADPSKIQDVYPYTSDQDQDIAPNLHALQKSATSGTLFTPQFGGGTANVEFEAETGLSLFWMP
ncbi:MAG: hypothetical protein FWF33_06665, partial [Clostridiales bacterium]|nr:hypothetical protein [Clostridiales bacterium]